MYSQLRLVILFKYPPSAGDLSLEKAASQLLLKQCNYNVKAIMLSE